MAEKGERRVVMKSSKIFLSTFIDLGTYPL